MIVDCKMKIAEEFSLVHLAFRELTGGYKILEVFMVYNDLKVFHTVEFEVPFFKALYNGE